MPKHNVNTLSRLANRDMYLYINVGKYIHMMHLGALTYMFHNFTSNILIVIIW